MSNIDNLLASARSQNPWDSARSRRVFEGAVKSRAARHRRQRFIAFACAASAAMFVLGVHAASAHSHTTYQTSDELVDSSQASSTGDSIGISGGVTYGSSSGTSSGAIAMSSDMFADGGRETD